MVPSGVVMGVGTVLEDDCLINPGASIRDHNTVGRGASVVMASWVKDVAAGYTLMGAPARELPFRAFGSKRTE